MPEAPYNSNVIEQNSLIRGNLNSEMDMAIPNQAEMRCFMKPEELAYLAGFIDGEGAFMINRRIHNSNGYSYEGYSAYIDIGNTDKDIMDWIKNISSCSSNVYKQKQPNNRRDVYRLRIAGKQAIELSKRLIPYLKIKKIFAEKFITFPLKHRKLDKPIAIQLFGEFRMMNQKNGKSHPKYSVCVETIQELPQLR